MEYADLSNSQRIVAVQRASYVRAPARALVRRDVDMDSRTLAQGIDCLGCGGGLPDSVCIDAKRSVSLPEMKEMKELCARPVLAELIRASGCFGKAHVVLYVQSNTQLRKRG